MRMRLWTMQTWRKLVTVVLAELCSGCASGPTLVYGARGCLQLVICSLVVAEQVSGNSGTDGHQRADQPKTKKAPSLRAAND